MFCKIILRFLQALQAQNISIEKAINLFQIRFQLETLEVFTILLEQELSQDNEEMREKLRPKLLKNFMLFLKNKFRRRCQHLHLRCRHRALVVSEADL